MTSLLSMARKLHRPAHSVVSERILRKIVEIKKSKYFGTGVVFMRKSTINLPGEPLLPIDLG